MGLSRRALLSAPLCLAFPLAAPALSQLLRPGAGHTEAQRQRAVRRGLEFLYRIALNRENFASHGSDLLWCFYSVSRAAADRDIERRASDMGRERARYWRRLNSRVAANANASELAAYVYGSLAADGFGIRNDQMKADLQRAVGRFGPVDYLKFDPVKELAPADVPEQCATCATDNPRGRVRCRTCGNALTMSDPYDVLCDALVTSYTGDSYGVTLGSSVADVMQVVPRMRPYPDPETMSYERFSSVIYAITHVIYVLNDYSVLRLDRQWLPQEFDYLRTHLHRSINAEDTELAGEFLDTLKSFGLALSDPALHAGVEFVLSRQNADGSWGDPETGDIYDLYHTTWTAICGLMDYGWRGEGVTFPDALRQARET